MGVIILIVGKINHMRLFKVGSCPHTTNKYLWGDYKLLGKIAKSRMASLHNILNIIIFLYAMLKTKIHVQNLAYCRYLQLWCIFYFCNIVESTPLTSITITSFFHIISLKINTKRIGILAQDYILMLLIYKYEQKLYLFNNLFVFLIY